MSNKVAVKRSHGLTRGVPAQLCCLGAGHVLQSSSRDGAGAQKRGVQRKGWAERAIATPASSPITINFPSAVRLGRKNTATRWNSNSQFTFRKVSNSSSGFGARAHYGANPRSFQTAKANTHNSAGHKNMTTEGNKAHLFRPLASVSAVSVTRNQVNPMIAAHQGIGVKGMGSPRFVAKPPGTTEFHR